MSQVGREFITMESKIKKLLKKQDVKLSSEMPPEIGSVMLVNKPKEKEWYRALVNKVVDNEGDYKVEVKLVDYGEELLVNREQLRKLPCKRVLNVPFQCIEFSLSGLRPALPKFQPTSRRAKQIPNGQWSVAATEYVTSTLKKASSVEVEVLGKAISGGLYGRLFVEWNESFMSLNEQLVSLNYAALDSEDDRTVPDVLNEQDIQHEINEKRPSIPDSPVEPCAEGSRSDHGIQKNAITESQEASDTTSEAFLPSVAQLSPPDNPVEEVSLRTRLRADVASSPLQQLGSSTSSPSEPLESSTGFLKCTALKGLGKHEAVSSADSRSVLTPASESPSITAKSQETAEGHQHQMLLSTCDTRELQHAQSDTDTLGLASPQEGSSDGCLVQADRDALLASPQTGESNGHSPQLDGDKLGLMLPRAGSRDGRSSQVGSDASGHTSPQAGASDTSQADSKASKLKDLLQARKHCSSSLFFSTEEEAGSGGSLDLVKSETTVKACDGSSLDGPAPAKAKPQAEKAASNRTSTLGQATARRRNKAPPEMEEYRDFMTPCDVIENVDEAAEEAKWNLKFTAKEQDLVAMNVCKASEDFRCHDFRNFSEVPPNLDPYMQLKDDAHFSGNFDSCRLPSLPTHTSKLRALCHGIRPPVLATTSLDEACFDDFLSGRLHSLGFRAPSCIQSVAWSPVSGNRNVVAVAPPHSGKTLAYLIPLISQVLSDSMYQMLREGVGPLVTVLTSTWKGAQRIYEQVKLLADETKGPTCCALYAAGSESGKEVPLVNGVDILVATPHSFLRYLNKYKRLILNLNRCCHLVLDDGDRLLDKYQAEVLAVVDEFVEGREKRLPSLQFSQILVCSNAWTSSLGLLLHMPKALPCPLVMFSSFLEAAVYAQVPTVVCYVDPNSRSEALLALLEEHRSRKVVVTATKREAAIAAHQLLSSSNVHSLLVHDELTMAAIREASSEWTSARPGNKLPVLVAQDSMLLLVGVRDAAVLVHYDVPAEVSEFNFGLRYFCIADRMRSFRDKEDTVHAPEGPVSYFILSRDDRNCSVQLVEFLRRLGSEIPDGLKELADEEQIRTLADARVALCPNIKSFGQCEEGRMRCSYRHHFLPQADHSPLWSDLPSEGKVRLLITKVMSASHFYAWILQYWGTSSGSTSGDTESKPEGKKNMEPYDTVSALNNYLSKSENCTPLDREAVPMAGQVYGLQCGTDHFQRVLVTSVTSGDHAPASVTVTHIDYGGQSSVPADQLIPLPLGLTQLRPLAVEVYCCGVRPPDGDVSWSFQADFRVHNLFFKKELVGWMGLRLGNTLWLDWLVLQQELPLVSATVTVRSVGGTLVQEGFGCKNPAHMENLRRMALDARILLPADTRACRESMNTRVKRQRRAHLDVEVYNHVYLWKVVSPAHFYVQPAQFSACLDRLEDDIQKAVEKKVIKKLERAVVGAPCIARSTDRWYRAEVLKVVGDNEVTVFFPDYGDTATCCLNELFEPHPSMMMLPYQGVLCSLAGIGPPTSGWSPEAQSVLEDFGFNNVNYNQVLCLRVVAKSSGDRSESNRYEVLLFNSCCAARVSAADRLVDQGLAIATTLPELSFNATHLHEPLQDEERDSSHSRTDSDDDDYDGQFLAFRRNLEEHIMDKMYAAFCKQFENLEHASESSPESSPEPSPEPRPEPCPEPFSQQDDVNASLPREEVPEKCGEPERQTQKELGREKSPQGHCQSKKKTAALRKKRSTKAKLEAAFKSGMPPLDSQFKTATSRLAPVSWWQDCSCVYVDVLVANATDYELNVTSSVLRLRTETAEQEFLVHERLRHSIVPEQTKLVQKELRFTITLEKARVNLTWDYLTRPARKVPHIRYDLNRVMDDDVDDIFEASKDPDFTGRTRLPVILPYDPVAEVDWNIEIEDNEEDVSNPSHHCLDFNNYFEGQELQ